MKKGDRVWLTEKGRVALAHYEAGHKQRYGVPYEGSYQGRSKRDSAIRVLIDGKKCYEWFHPDFWEKVPAKEERKG